MNKESKIWVTGASGFLGQALVKRLKDLGYLSIWDDKIDLMEFDNPNAVREYMWVYQIEYVVHLAGHVGGITYNKENSAKLLYDNTQMALNIFEACRANKHRNFKKLLTCGSVCEYPSNTPIPFKEENVWNGYPETSNASYGMSKRLMMEMTKSYSEQYEMNCIHPLMINLYGPNDKFKNDKSHVIAAMIKKFVDAKENGKPSVSLFGDGTPTRDFLYVDDAADALIFLMENYDSSKPINVGSGNEYSIKEIAELIQCHVGYGGKIFWDTDKPNGQMRRKLDITKMADRGWEPKIKLEDGLKKTIAWYKEKLSTSF